MIEAPRRENVAASVAVYVSLLLVFAAFVELGTLGTMYVVDVDIALVR